MVSCDAAKEKKKMKLCERRGMRQKRRENKAGKNGRREEELGARGLERRKQKGGGGLPLELPCPHRGGGEKDKDP